MFTISLHIISYEKFWRGSASVNYYFYCCALETKWRHRQEKAEFVEVFIDSMNSFQSHAASAKSIVEKRWQELFIWTVDMLE